MTYVYRSRAEERAAAAAERMRAETERAERLAAVERQQQDHAADRAEREQERRAAARRERASARRARVRAVVGAVQHHVPVMGVPVVGISMVMAWGGQMDAAKSLGFGGYAPLVPALLEGLTLTLAAMTSAAIQRRHPSRRLMAYTWGSALLAAGINAYGHVLTATALVAIVFALASLVGVFVWWLAASAGRMTRTLDDIRAARARSRHTRRRRRRFRAVARAADDAMLAAPYGTVDDEDAWALAWREVYGHPTPDTGTDTLADTVPDAWLTEHADAADTVRWCASSQVGTKTDTPTDTNADTGTDTLADTPTDTERTPRRVRRTPDRTGRRIVDPTVLAAAAERLRGAGITPSARSLAEATGYGRTACAAWLRANRR